MPHSYCFYVHHHGAGHITRALTIAKELYPHELFFMGSDLHRYRSHIPGYIRCLHLPSDLPVDGDAFYRPGTTSCLHYAPLNVKGLRERNNIMTTYFRDHPNSLCIVDVSAEVTMLAKLCGVPTVVIRQHGKRGDLAHQLAYENAELIIAPYPEMLSSKSEEGLFTHKTFFSGGFSRYTDRTGPSAPSSDTHLAIFVGHGGTRIDSYFIRHLRHQIPSSYHLHIVGQLEEDIKLNHCTFYGHLPDPEQVIDGCSIVICNAGHNTIMEMVDLHKRIICIPAVRPFDEQEVKCSHLERLGLAVVVKEEDVFDMNWNARIKKAGRLNHDSWANLMNPMAAREIADRLNILYEQQFVKE